MITIRFTKPARANGPLTEATIEFHADAGPLAGFELTGFAIWPAKTNPSGYSVTFPSRSWEKDGKKEYFNFLRLRKEPGIPDSQKWAVQNWIIEQFKKTQEPF